MATREGHAVGSSLVQTQPVDLPFELRETPPAVAPVHTPQQYETDMQVNNGCWHDYWEAMEGLGEYCICQSTDLDERCTSSPRACLQHLRFWPMAAFGCITMLFPALPLAVLLVRFKCRCHEYRDTVVSRSCPRCQRANDCGARCREN
eukprot:m.46380 g.46380  ORF g.46380 m.46380 type:complete len:148 (+) comp47398_c0_seq1:41-484(+)